VSGRPQTAYGGQLSNGSRAAGFNLFQFNSLWHKKTRASARVFQRSISCVFRYVGEISVIIVAIKTVADDEKIGNSEVHLIRLEVNDSAVGLIQKGDDSEGEGISFLQDRNDLLERSARVDDVLDDDDVIIADILRKVHGDLYLTAGRRAGVALCAHECDLARNGDRAAKVCHKDERAVENADEQDRSAVIGTVDLLACLFDRGIDLFLGDDDILDLASECFDGLEFFHDDFSLMNKMIYFT
jgi:hypothetical protein